MKHIHITKWFVYFILLDRFAVRVWFWPPTWSKHKDANGWSFGPLTVTYYAHNMTLEELEQSVEESKKQLLAKLKKEYKRERLLYLPSKKG